MNITGLRKLVAAFCTIPVLYLFFFPVAFAQDLNMSPEKNYSHLKMSSYLEKLQAEYEKSGTAKKLVAQGLNVISSHDPDRVTVYLMSASDISLDENALYNLGAQIIKQYDNVIKATVPIDMLTAIADTVKGVSFMKTPDKLIPVAVTSEGVNRTGADNFHNVGYTGSGVKVAVIDVGFAGLSSAIPDELPNNVIKVDCTGIGDCVASTFPAETDSHGTAVAEIVYDMAPGATIYLIKVNDTADLVFAKKYAVDNGIRIINHSLVVANTNFYDGECYASNPVCTANDAYASNILWVNAAANQAQSHYEADFTDSDSDGWHNVSGSSETIRISATAGDTIEVYLTWDAWPATSEDYNLYLLDSALDVIPLPSGTTTQSNSPPIEEISYNVTSTDTYYYIAIFNNSATPLQLEVYSINHDLTPTVASSSLLGPADAAGAMAVGAINYNNWTTGPQASYSSRGPTNGGRTKPDIMGPDNVSTDVYVSRFTGTSASSAHVAGAAALVLDKFPGTSVEDLWNFLTATAIDMGSPGKDNTYGFGRLKLDINAVIPSGGSAPTVSGGGGGGGCFIATAAYGSYAAPCVQILRNMRDRFFLTNNIGKRVVNLYYKYSPPMADFISNHDNVKIFVRLSLLPLVGISWIALRLGPLFTISLMVLFMFGLIRRFSNRTFSRKDKV